VNRSYLSKVEKAETYVGLEIIGKLASVLDIESLRTDSALARKVAVITYRMLVDGATFEARMAELLDHDRQWVIGGNRRRTENAASTIAKRYERYFVR
jgi:hypothetical protein